MASICYNLTYQCRVDENNRPLASRPQLAFTEETSWELHFFQGEPGDNTPADLSRLISCRAAVDCDYRSGSAPMCRTSQGIDLSRAADGIITVPLDADTETFSSALGAEKEIEAIFELQGFDTNGTALIASFEITARNVIDAQGGEAPAAPQNDLASKAWTRGQIAQTLILEFSADGNSWHSVKTAGDHFQRMRHGSDGVPSAATELPPESAVSRVNGSTGDVVIRVNGQTTTNINLDAGDVGAVDADALPEMTLTGATFSPKVLGRYAYTAEQGASIYMTPPESGKTVFDLDITVPAGTVSFAFAQTVNWKGGTPEFTPGTTTELEMRFTGGTWQGAARNPDMSQYLQKSYHWTQGDNISWNIGSGSGFNVFSLTNNGASIAQSSIMFGDAGRLGNFTVNAAVVNLDTAEGLLYYKNRKLNTKGSLVASDVTTGNITSPGDVIATLAGGTVAMSDLATVNVDGGSATTATIALTGGTRYKYGELTALTLSSIENSDREATIIFLSGATATVVTLPGTEKWIGGEAPTIEANATYCISVQNNLAVCGKFAQVTV